MSDKLSPGISVLVNFAEGEIPSPAKLTAITAQLSRAADKLEKAVGDIHSQSWPYTSNTDTTLSSGWGENSSTGNTLSGAAERKLDIANLARLMGPASNLNPKMLTGAQPIEDDIPVGVHEFATKYPISGTITATNPTVTDGSLTNWVPTAAAMQIAGDYSVEDGGKVRCYTATAGGTIEYTTDPSEWAGGTNFVGASFNVIPDPNQVGNGDGCAIGVLDGQNRWPVVLPVATYQQSDIDGLSIGLDQDDVNFERQLLLPEVLVDNFLTGEEIPAGFLFLKNETTGEVYEDAVYYYNNSSSVLAGNVDLAAAKAAGNVFSVITVGTSVTASIDDLRNKHLHNHDRSMGEPYIPVDSIIGQYETPALSGPYTASDMPANPFSQYLHRDGYRAGYDDNMNDANIMRGTLMMGKQGGTAGNYIGDGESFKIRFGQQGSSEPYIYRTSTDDLEIYNQGGDIILKNDSLLLANKVKIVDSHLQVFEGIIGDVVGTVGILSPGIAPYAIAGTFTDPDPIVVGDFYTIDLPASIRDKRWYSMHIMFNVEPGTDRWIPPRQHNIDDWLYIAEIADNGATSHIKVAFQSGDWLTLPDPPEFDYRVMIWYQP